MRTILFVLAQLLLCSVAFAGCGAGGIGPDWDYDAQSVTPHTKPQRNHRQHRPRRVAPRRSSVRVGALDVGLAIARGIKR